MTYNSSQNFTKLKCLAILRRLSQPNTVMAMVITGCFYGIIHKPLNGAISVLITGISGHNYMIYFHNFVMDSWTHNLQHSCSMFFFQNRSQPNAHHLPCFSTHLWFPLGTPARYLASWLWQPPTHLPVVFGNFEGIRQVGHPQLWPFTSYKYLNPIYEMYIPFKKKSYT